MITASISASVLMVIVLVLAYFSRSKLESLLYYIAGYFFGGDIQSRIALETPVAKTTLMTASGDLVTYLRVRGARRLIGPAEFNDISERISDLVRIMLSDGTGRQHALSVGFLSDPPGTRNIVRNLLQSMRTSAQRMGASKQAQKWFDAREDLMSELCNDESVIIALYTLRSGLSPKESESYAQWATQARQKVTQQAGKKGVRAGEAADPLFSQTIKPVWSMLAQRHKAMVDSFIHGTGSDLVGILVEELEGAEALYCLRRFVDGTQVPISWRPDLFGDHEPRATQATRSGDAAHMLPSPIARQLFTEPMREHFDAFETVEREGVFYGSLKLDVCPHEEPVPGFARFMGKVGVGFPFSIHFEVSPNGLDYKKMDQMFSAFFGGFGSHNRALRDAWQELKRRAEVEGGYNGALRMVCSTWARDESTLGDQISTLKMALQNWGGATVSNESGAPANMLLASAPGLSRFNPAPYLPAPIETVSRMLPLYQPASPWDAGQLLLRTSQGRPYPVFLGASNQAFWGSLVFAPPGRGKSFLMNALNAGLIFSPGLSDLPYMTIIDKGMSSANVIELARAILPPERRHQALSIRLRNTLDYAVNPFDTQLGLDHPTERERDFQVNLISAVCPNLGPEGVRFVGQVIDEAYKMLGRDSLQARRWQRALDAEISARLEAEGAGLDDNDMPRIWEVVDRLFDMDDPHAASMAQRFAVPILDDLISAAHADSVQDLYRNTPAPTGEKITDVFVRSVTTAAREYKLLSTYTRFDIGDARVVSIDLEEVLASATSEESRRRAAVMILFARQLGAKNYYLKYEEIAPLVPKRYEAYQSRRVKVIFETLKFLEYDEFHNAHGMMDVLRMVEQDFREGRKYQVVTLLSSQLFGDFSPQMIEVTTNFFILGVGSAEASHKVQEAFELSETERKCILNDCLGPGPKGAPLFGMFKTDRGTVTQFLFNSASSMERWAFNSSALDVAVRSAVRNLLNDNYWSTLLLLSEIFPSGSARDEIARLRETMAADETADDEGVAATVARSAVESYRRRHPV